MLEDVLDIIETLGKNVGFGVTFDFSKDYTDVGSTNFYQLQPYSCKASFYVWNISHEYFFFV